MFWTPLKITFLMLWTPRNYFSFRVDPSLGAQITLRGSPSGEPRGRGYEERERKRKRTEDERKKYQQEYEERGRAMATSATSMDGKVVKKITFF